jgi:hypothetical protein
VTSTDLNYSPGNRAHDQIQVADVDTIDLRRQLVRKAGMFEPGCNQLVTEPSVRRAPIPIKSKRDDCQRIVRLADLLAQDIPIQLFLLVSDWDAAPAAANTARCSPRSTSS